MINQRYTTVFSRLSMPVAFSIVLAACSSDTGSILLDDDQSADTAALRAELSTAMSTHRALPYADVWDALSEIHEVSPGRIRLFYTQRIVDASARAAGDGQSDLQNWNREHLWPQSYGIRPHPARTDLHNLVPADQTVNSSRGNKYFDEGTEPHRECALCSITTEAWEPPDEVKGDIARMMFYVDVRYEGLLDDGIGNLALASVPEPTVKTFGNLATLLDWHCQDPVSEDEVTRHDRTADIQGNRNAFIDSPELVESLYSTECTDEL